MVGWPDLEQLQAEWYSRLKESGFRDIEERGMLKDWHSLHFFKRSKRSTNAAMQQAAEYYTLAEELLYTHTFRSERERSIWLMHSEGAPLRRIAGHLGVSAMTVQKAIKRIAALMLEDRCKS
jgi:hypothetical protein